MDVRLELAGGPVSDPDRAIAFYVERAGFVLDHDIRVDERVRFIQVTPPGSACSIMLDSFSGAMAPGDAARPAGGGRGRRRRALRAPRTRGGGERGGPAAVGPLRALRGPGRQHLGAAAAPGVVGLTAPASA